MSLECAQIKRESLGKKNSNQLILRILRSFIIVYIGVFVGLYALQRVIIFKNGSERIEPSAAHVPEMKEQIVTSPDGAEIVVWTSDLGEDHPLILYFHGNAGVLGHRGGRFRAMLDRGWSVVGMGLRGGSGSSGSPTEQSLTLDARAVYDALPHLLGREIEPDMIVLYGESLGTGIAVTLATEREVGAVILETPYAAMDDLAQLKYPVYPLKIPGLIKDPFRSIDRIDRINAPLLVMHGTRDKLIPFSEAKRLFHRAADPKWYHWFEEGRHSDLWSRGAVVVIEEFMERYY